MTDIKIKTLGVLIDELFTTDHKCWEAQDKLMDSTFTESERLQASIQAHKLNKRRNELIRAIDESVGQINNSVTEKTY
jgi:hypothetical protein